MIGTKLLHTGRTTNIMNDQNRLSQSNYAASDDVEESMNDRSAVGLVCS